MADENVVAEETAEDTIEEATEGKTRKATKVTGVSKDAGLKVIVEENPKRTGSASYERFEGYFKDGIEVVQDALDVGLTMGDIKYDVAHSYIEVEGAEIEEYEVQARGSRKSKEVDPDLVESVDEDLLDSGEDDGGDLFGETEAA